MISKFGSHQKINIVKSLLVHHRTLGQTLHRPKLFVDSFSTAEEMRASTDGEGGSE